MKTYNSLPKKYNNEAGTIKVIDGYAYATYYNRNHGTEDRVVRITEAEYNSLREQAQGWDVYKAEPTEANLQLQISEYLDGNEPYCIAKC